VESLQAYEGTLVFVSHDRAFVDALATRVIEVRKDGVTDFPGRFKDYLRAQHDDHLDGDAIAKKVRAEQKEQKELRGDGGSSALSWEEQKKRKNRVSSLEKKRDQVLKEIEITEAKKKAIEDTWAEPGYFERTPIADVEAAQAKDRALQDAVAELVGRWEEIELELAELTS